MRNHHHWHGDLLEAWKKYGIFGKVEATHFEHMTLWRESSTHGDLAATFASDRKVDWAESSMGTLVTLPDELNTTISLNVDVLDGKAILFWECTSVKCDHDAANKWIKETFNPKHSCDPMNFGNMITAIKSNP